MHFERSDNVVFMKYAAKLTMGVFVCLLLLPAFALAIECTADSTKTITIGQSKSINVQCTGIGTGTSVTVTHAGYNQNCLTTSKTSASLSQASPSASFSFDALSTACDSNPNDRTITWSFNDGSNTYQDTTVASIESYAITATLSGDSSATAGSSATIFLTVTNTGNKDVSTITISETSSTGLLSGKSISTVSAQGSQAVSWTFTAPSAGTYSITVQADAPTTDPASDSMTLTVTAAGGDDTPPATPSAGGGGGGGAAAGAQGKNVTGVISSPGLLANTKLQAAIGKVLGMGTMNQNAIQNLLQISNMISTQSAVSRSIDVSGSTSNVKTTVKYAGTKPAKNYIVYETVPKAFANSSDLITVTAAGARVEIVEKDPEYAIVFATVSPNQELSVTYTISQAVSTSTVDSFATEVYAESLVETVVNAGAEEGCAQVITPAKNPATGECREFSTPCDVPDGWTTVSSCAQAAATSSGDSTTTGTSKGKSKVLYYVIGVLILLVAGALMHPKIREKYFGQKL